MMMLSSTGGSAETILILYLGVVKTGLKLLPDAAGNPENCQFSVYLEWLLGVKDDLKGDVPCYQIEFYVVRVDLQPLTKDTKVLIARTCQFDFEFIVLANTS